MTSPLQWAWLVNSFKIHAATRIFHYIKSVPRQSLLYGDHGNTQIVGYLDADWARSTLDRQSNSRYCALFEGNLISWKSKKQVVVARSSLETKYQVMTIVTYELNWLKQLLQELKQETISAMKLMW